MSRHLILGTAGHVDHGKTALIKALTGIDCDTHKEEKERGITINLGFAHLDLPSGENIGIVDVPGHRDFIRTMVAGAYGIDLVMLVIAADSGVMPQTVEHLNIIRSLGIQTGLVALTKADLADDETLELARLEVMEFLEGTPFEHAPIVPVSAVTGTGLDVLVNEIDALIPGIPDKPAGAVFRMYIDRLFHMKGQGYVVTGTVMNGSVKTGDELYLLPGVDKELKVRQIQRHGKSVSAVCAGDRAALNLSGISAEDFERGVVLSGQRLPSTLMTDASLILFSEAENLSIWSQVIFLTGTLKCKARIHLLDKDQLMPGGSALVQIHLDKPAFLMNGDHYVIRNSSNDTTIGGGMVMDITPLHHKKRSVKLVEYLKDLREAGGGRPLPNSSPTGEGQGVGNKAGGYWPLPNPSPDGEGQELGYRLQEVGGRRQPGLGWIKIEMRKEAGPFFPETIAARLNLSPDDVLNHINELLSSEVHVYNPGSNTILIMNSLDESIRQKVLSVLRQWHEANPLLESGLDAKGLAGKLSFHSTVQKQYLDALLDAMQKEGSIRKSGSAWLLEGFQVTIDKKMQESLDWLDKTIEQHGAQRSVATEMEQLVTAAQARGIGKQKLLMMLVYLAKEGILYFHDDDYLHRTVVDHCRNLLLAELKDREAGINEKEFRLLIDGTKRIVQVLIGIFIQEGSIIKQSFYLKITEKGKMLLQL
ncbi:MAG TPA: selenocysteine-specific translation elongation factor [Bacteroidales bacterium]|nr:selenocysteine-specific translation elongation factor [Bacteroidales bacterium]HRZ20309.1 selenocysteine-specific translation elongation factor [Bacteroidales bacterium]